MTQLFAEALTVVETSADDLREGLDLFLKHEQLGAFDAILAGVGVRRGADALVSADRAFGSVHGLSYVDPARARLDRLLRSGT